YGTEYSFEHSNPLVDGRTVYAGIDAFASINQGIAAAEEDGTVYLAPGTFNETVTIAKRVHLAGDGSTATTTINGALHIAVSGADPLDPLVISGLVVSNPAGHGMALGGTVSNLHFQGVAFDASADSGVSFAG